MTPPASSEPAATFAAVVSAQADRERQAQVQHAIRRLTLTLEATNLALGTAERAPHNTGAQPLTAAQILDGWHAANLLVRTVFRDLHYEVRGAIDVLELMLPPG
jgi:hypothetical protein